MMKYYSSFYHCIFLLILLGLSSPVLSQCSLNAPDTDMDGVCDILDICPNVDDSLLGSACDDGDACTQNDIWTTACECLGTMLLDSDNDGVCDIMDACADFDDSMDIDKDDIPYCLDNCVDANQNGICDDVDGGAFSGELKIHFSHKRGHYSSPFILELIPNYPGAVIRYEIGTNPVYPTVNSGIIYSTSINVSSSTLVTIKAIAYTATETSKVYTHTYILDGKNKEAVVFSSSPYPVAIGEVEDPISFEFIVPYNSSLKSVQAYSGTKLSSGGSSAGQSDKIFFRSDYDTPTLKEDLFSDHYYGRKPEEKIDQLFLRYQHNDDTNLRQIVAHDASKDAGQLAPNGRFVNFYNGGQFVEIRHLQERPEGGFMESYTGIDKPNWESITSHHNQQTPSTAYNSLKSIASTWTDFKNSVNIESFSYFIIAGWIANTVDYWEDHNFRASGPSDLSLADGEDNSWHFFMWDPDLGYGRVYERFDGTSWPSESEAWSSPWQFKVPFISPEFMLTDLVNHDEFRLNFADVINCSMRGDGGFTESKFLDRIWYRTNELNDFGKDNLFFGTLMDTWMPEKLDWLFNELRQNQYYPEMDEVIYSHESGGLATGTLISLTNPNPSGDIYYSLDGTDVRMENGNLSASAILYQGSFALTSGVHELIARVYDVNAVDLIDTWSAHCCAKEYYINQPYSDLVINEIHYNPEDSIFYNPATSMMDTLDGRNFEFVELKNTGTSPINIQFCSFTKGINVTIDEPFIVPAGGFVLFAEDSDWFLTKYGITADFEYDGKLDNGGETLIFADPGTYHIDEVTYDDTTPWDDVPDLGIYSLAFRTDALNNDVASGWEAQYVSTTPGSENLHCADLAISFNSTDESCPNANDGSVSVLVTNAIGPFSYQWTHGPVSSSLSGLSPGMYIVKVTDLSTGCESADTLNINPAAALAPINLSLTSANANSLILNWNSIPGNSIYNLQYREVGQLLWTNYSTSSTIAILSNLNACTDYELKIGGDCSADGISGFNPIKIFSTTDCFVCTSPSGLYQFNIQSFSAIITWDVLVGASNYTYKYRKVGDLVWNSQTTTFPIAVLFGTNGCTDYEWTLETTCYDGSTAQSGTINNFTTACKNDFSEQVTNLSQNLILYPNPTIRNLNIQLPYRVELADLTIYNQNGQIVHSSSIRDKEKSDLIKIDIEALSPGLYSLSVGDMNSIFLKQ